MSAAPMQRAGAAHGASYRVEACHDYNDVASRWNAMAQRGSALAFQGANWLSAWYANPGKAQGAAPLLLTVIDAQTGADIMALPLVRRIKGALNIIEFADNGLTDYNAPILSRDAPHAAAGAQRIWSAIRASLAQADLIRLEKMPHLVEAAPNPLALLPQARPSRLNGNILRIGGEWSEWHWGLERTFRKELERSWRVFSKHPGARFMRLQEAKSAQPVFAALKQIQGARIRELGLPYALDDLENDAFYTDLLGNGVGGGEAILTALAVGETIVAALLGIARGDHYSMVRLAASGGEWKNCSPGRLMIERTMMSLHAEGFRTFDFTIGDYAYKRRLGAAPVELCEIESALSLRGAPHAAASAMRARLRENQALAGFVRRLRGQA